MDKRFGSGATFSGRGGDGLPAVLTGNNARITSVLDGLNARPWRALLLNLMHDRSSFRLEFGLPRFDMSGRQNVALPPNVALIFRWLKFLRQVVFPLVI